MSEVFYWNEETKSVLSLWFEEEVNLDSPSFFRWYYDGKLIPPLLCFKSKDECIKYYEGSYEE